MKDFVLLFRQPITPEATAPEMEASAWLKKWDDWFGGIAAQGQADGPGK